MFADASALAAVLLDEEDATLQLGKLLDADRVLVSAVACWETVRACVKEQRMPVAEARAATSDLLAVIGATFVPIGDAEREAALEAYERFGEGVHRAKLNMGDCFAYACAKTNGVPLLFKGQDFVHTDIERA